VTAQDLIGTARALVADDKGLLAMDASTPACNRRFAALGIPQTQETRRAYRELGAQRVMLGEDDPEAQHGASGIDVLEAGSGRRVADVTATCLLRTVPTAVPGIAFLSGGQSGELASARFKRDECQVQVASAMGGGVFVCPRHPAAGSGDLARRENPRVGGAARSASPGRLQSGGAARRGEYTAEMESN
jgi:hypothetical protein